MGHSQVCTFPTAVLIDEDEIISLKRAVAVADCGLYGLFTNQPNVNQVRLTWTGCEHSGSPLPSSSTAWKRTRPAVWMRCKPDERRAFTLCSSAQSIAFEVGQEFQKKKFAKSTIAPGKRPPGAVIVNC